ncbi:hypothetical protein EI94DRAFT_1701921 [Lactarius quietus]|nr:hypothetical protein EI94DRAFT_1701921 [Lactarius quietus]
MFKLLLHSVIADSAQPSSTHPSEPNVGESIDPHEQRLFRSPDTVELVSPPCAPSLTRWRQKSTPARGGAIAQPSLRARVQHVLVREQIALWITHGHELPVAASDLRQLWRDRIVALLSPQEKGVVGAADDVQGCRHGEIRRMQ